MKTVNEIAKDAVNESTLQPTQPLRLVAVSAGISVPSSTRLLTDRLAQAAESAAAESGRTVKTELVELRNLATDIAHAMVTGFAGPALAKVLDDVAAADGLIAVTPIFSGSYSGLFKSFFDVMDNTALIGKPVLIGATGGTPRHSLALEHALRPLFAYLRAIVAPTGVYAASQDWGTESDSHHGELAARINRAGRELTGFMLCRPPADGRGTGVGAGVAGHGVAGEDDDFDTDEIVPFAQHLAALNP